MHQQGNQRTWWSLCVRHIRPDALVLLWVVSFKSDTKRFSSSSAIIRSVGWKLDCSPRCCFQLLFSLSLHFYLAASIFNDVLKSRTWKIKYHIMKLRVGRSALRWFKCYSSVRRRLYVCEKCLYSSLFFYNFLHRVRQLQPSGRRRVFPLNNEPLLKKTDER